MERATRSESGASNTEPGITNASLVAMKITSKGQVTIPKHVREILGMLPGTEVEILVDGDKATIRKADAGEVSRGEQIVRHLESYRGSLIMTTDEIMQLTRGD